ncbi:MAG: EAL domain-containing protein [Proteobacteria bacterium]|nr:EAL domain-containing protein [Pseudomonadota bacterium]
MGDEEFRLVFQPIVHLDGEDKLYGFEALIRWEHPTRGLIMPSDFIPLAEETDRIMFLGMWALRNACLAMAKFIKMHPKAGRLVMSVNLSAKQLVSTSLAVDILDVLELTGVPPAALNLEITETTLMEGGSAAIARLKDLADAGISFSIDDFGTGYSSMAYLSQLPLDNMKIDLSFVRMMDVNPNNIEIVRAIIQLAHSLGLEVVAEGVEKDVQRIKLMELGCEYYQGYLFSMPLSFQEAGQLIVNQLEAEH